MNKEKIYMLITLVLILLIYVFAEIIWQFFLKDIKFIYGISIWVLITLIPSCIVINFMQNKIWKITKEKKLKSKPLHYKW